MTIQATPRRNSKLMRQRRARILETAKDMILKGGIDALSVRALAEAADVAAQTIYRLIGSKDEVLVALFAQSQQQWEERVAAFSSADPLTLVEAAAVESARLFAEDEEYHRSAYLAIEHLYEMQSRSPAVTRVFKHGEDLLVAGYQACIDAGLLRGNISAAALAYLALHAWRNSLKEWASGHISLQQLRRETTMNAHILLMADGTTAFRELVQGRLPARELQDEFTPRARAQDRAASEA